MAQIVINVPDAQRNRILDAFANLYGWSSNLGVTKAAFMQSMVVEFIKDVVKNHDGSRASNNARVAADSDLGGIT